MTDQTDLERLKAEADAAYAAAWEAAWAAADAEQVAWAAWEAREAAWRSGMRRVRNETT